MGDMFRSEEMALCQIFIQPEAAYASMSELGEKGCIQFRDLNSNVNAFQRNFVFEIRRCNELERGLRYIQNELDKEDILLPPIDEDNMPATINPCEIVDLEAKVESIETELRELSLNAINLENNFRDMIEMKHVLEHADEFFSDHDIMHLDSNLLVDSLGDNQKRAQLNFIAGVIKLEKFFAFERMLWRIGRGNIFIKRSELSSMVKDPETGHPVLKTMFVIFFQGEQLQQRIKKIYQAFHASIYPCPNGPSERDEMLKNVRARLEDLKMVLNKTADHRNRVLIAAARNVTTWSVIVTKNKAIYHTLNMFNKDVSKKYLIGEGWVPTQDLVVVKKALEVGAKSVKSTMTSFLNVIESNEQPPTFMRTNKFTLGFQNLIDSYGVASYREINPALYSIIIFPFLFAVMFGDLGHGFIMFLCALYMVLKEDELRKNKSEIFNIFFGGRYIILLMGLFSMYTGFIYNDIFSLSMNIFGSRWRVRYNTTTVLSNKDLQMDPAYHVKGVYPLGMDPIWQLADNKIIFINSYKMKLSIIFGVVHMSLGIIMSLINYTYFRKTINIVMDFIPKMIFLTLLFGYMAFMMFFKFARYSATTEKEELTPGCAPSILILFINMILFKHQQPLEGCKEYMFEAQEIIQTVFVIVVLICIPWMLFGKPIFYMIKRKRAISTNYTNGGIETEHSTSQDHAEENHENEPISELFLEQAIQTIEYVLSTISHTASYLRLWALSLAHSQLSDVLWNKIMHMGFILPGYFGIGFIVIVFLFWAILTFAILLLIEGLSAFLHTLRLHWVEFMSKFYVGLGYAFQPFSFKVILNSGDED